jgi:hypothetical protein
VSKTVLQVRIGQALKQVQVDTSVAVVAQQAAVYQLVWAETSKPVKNVVLRRVGDALRIEVDGQPEVRIEKFFEDGAQVAYDLGAAPAAGASSLVTPAAVAAADTGIVWQAQDNAGLVDGLGGSEVIGLGALLGGALLRSGAVSNVVKVNVVAGPVLDGNDLVAIIYAADGKRVLG